jgi:serine/threonine protein phosphatase 1
MIKVFEPNLTGQDYVVGDIHANFSKLAKQLSDIGFNPKLDRLFSVGDLVDRGHEHDLLLYWLDMPWFHAVRGNHEDMIMRSRGEETQVYLSRIHGGQWFLELSHSAQNEVLAALKKLPLGMEIHGKDGKVYGVVHADVCWNQSWQDFKDNPGNDECMWSRSRIQYKDTKPVEGIDLLFVGHTPTEPLILGNVVYLDNGAWRANNLDKQFNIQQL